MDFDDYFKEDPRFEWAKNLKAGDLVNDCRYLNVKIKTITPCISYDNGKVYDFDIITEDDHSCSLTSCCGMPMTDEEIKEEMGLIDVKDYDLEGSIKWVTEHPYHNHLKAP